MSARPRTFMGRLGNKVDFNGADGCWNFTGCTRYGYGQIRRGAADRGITLTHRAMFENYYGPIPEGLELDHICKNPRCCNPEHLEPVTGEENRRRSDSWAARNARVTRCPQGHPYDSENTYRNPNSGRRHCRTCVNAMTRRWALRKKLQAAGDHQ